MSQPPKDPLPVMAPESSAASRASYGQILKSTTIVGGAQGLNLLIGLVRTKLVAILLGPSGIGLVGLYQSVTGTISTLTSLGLASSGVRHVAEAASQGDQQKINQAALVLKRICWLTGLLGAVVSLSLAWPLSHWVFDSVSHAWAIGILGGVCLLDSVTAARTALIQGLRNIGDLARVQVVSALGSTLMSIGLYSWLHDRGIVPVLLLTSAVNLGVAAWFSRKVTNSDTSMTWGQTWMEARGLISLGLAFMMSGVLASGVALVTRALIIRSFGMEANGLYQAAWGVSGVFAGFVLQAMGADFYPRLTAVASDHGKMNRMVNEQTEVGVLLALPGLLATLIFAPWVLHLLYSASFVSAGELLPWFILGIFGRVVSWPLAFIQLAKGAARWYAMTEIIFSLIHVAFVFLLLKMFGLKGVGIAFALLYGIYTIGVLCAAKYLSGFFWSFSTLRLLGGAVIVTGLSFVLVRAAPPVWATTVGSGLVVLIGCVCVRQLCRRLEESHQLVRLVRRVPGVGLWMVS